MSKNFIDVHYVISIFFFFLPLTLLFYVHFTGLMGSTNIVLNSVYY